MFVAHRERHHSLIKAGFAEERLRMLIDEFKNAFAPPLDLGLQSAHMQKVIARSSEVKAKEFLSSGKKCGRDTVTLGVNSELGGNIAALKAALDS
ncbi:MAG TPA: hypothetical protein VFP82_02980, partial [Chthoniobacterales bacterium]|nr:hypothetical protein [Chthoniobacterales bacterium]